MDKTYKISSITINSFDKVVECNDFFKETFNFKKDILGKNAEEIFKLIGFDYNLIKNLDINIANYIKNHEIIISKFKDLKIYHIKDTLSEITKKSEDLKMVIDNMNRAFSLHEMIFDYDGIPIDYKFIKANESFYKITGLSDNIINKKISEIFDEENAKEWIKIYSKIFTENKKLHFERYSKSLKKYYLIDAYKQNSNKFITIFEDITNLKIKEKYNLDIINSTLSASFLVDKEGKILMLNDRGCKFFNLGREEIIGKKMSEFLPEELVKSKRKKYLEVVFTGKPVYFIDSFNGEYFENYIYPILKNNEIEHIAIHGKNITKQIKIEKDLENAKIKAEKSDILKSKFLSNMSHEIRTPLNTIIGFSDLLIDDNYNNIIDTKKYLKTINANSKHLDELLNNILEYTKIETGDMKSTLIYEKFEINDIYEELKDIFYLKNDNSIEIIFEDRSDTIICDYLRLKQVLYNLISNSLKFTESGYIKIGSTIKDNLITFFVEDTGIGIPKDKLNVIFDRFVQVDDSSKKRYRGAGLGLSISKNIIKSLDGDIWAHSVEKKGSIFFFAIPQQKKEHKSLIKIKTKANFNNLKVIVIEDIPENFSKLGSILKDINVSTKWYDEMEFNDLEILNEIENVFIEVNMHRKKESYKLIEKIKQKNKNATIVTISTFNINLDCVDYKIIKPLSKKNIIDTIRKITDAD